MIMDVLGSEKNIKKVFKKKFSIFILWMIKEKQDTGYGLVKRLNEEKININYSQLYPLLNTLNKKGYIEKIPANKGKRMRYIYKITKEGNQCFTQIKDMVTPSVKRFIKFLIK